MRFQNIVLVVGILHQTAAIDVDFNAGKDIIENFASSISELTSQGI